MTLWPMVEPGGQQTKGEKEGAWRSQRGEEPEWRRRIGHPKQNPGLGRWRWSQKAKGRWQWRKSYHLSTAQNQWRGPRKRELHRTSESSVLDGTRGGRSRARDLTRGSRQLDGTGRAGRSSIVDTRVSLADSSISHPRTEWALDAGFWLNYGSG